MKRIISLLLLSIFLFAGCGGKEDSGKDLSALSLPYDMDLNGKTLYAESVQFYQEESDHGVYIYAVATLDISNLSDDDVYWMDENDSFEITLYVSSEESGIDLDRMLHAGTVDEGGKRYLSFWMLEELRTYSDAKYSMVITLTQKEQYSYKNDEGQTREMNKRNRYSFSSVELSDSLPNTVEMKPEVYDRMLQTLNAMAS